MIIFNTYQQDSLKEVNPLAELNHLPEPGEMEAQDSVSVSHVEKPGAVKELPRSEKIFIGSTARKNLWQHEQKLLVGNSRFIEPRNDLNLIASLAYQERLHLPERPVNSSGYDWITLMLLVALALFASVKTSWGQYMKSLFHSTLNYATAIRMFQEKNNSLLQGMFQLDVLFYLIFSVFLFQTFDFFRIDLPYRHFNLYLFCLALVILYFMGKNIIYRFMGLLVEKKGETGEFLFNVDNFKRVAGLVLIPMVAIVSFYPFSQVHLPIFAGMTIIGFIYSLLILRGFKILFKKQFSIFYLFLYFCTLEFLPLVLLYKILVV